MSATLPNPTTAAEGLRICATRFSATTSRGAAAALASAIERYLSAEARSQDRPEAAEGCDRPTKPREDFVDLPRYGVQLGGGAVGVVLLVSCVVVAVVSLDLLLRGVVRPLRKSARISKKETRREVLTVGTATVLVAL